MPARSGTSSSSMHTSTSFSSSLVETSPSRHSPNRSNLRPHRESLTRDPYGSPAHKLALEFNLRLSISDREFNEKLDKAAAVRAEQHQQQLAYAAEEHERVYRSAKLELERQALEEEQARLRHEENQKREIERLKQEKAREQAEAQRRALEARQREEEAARQAAEHQKKLQEADARIKARKEQEAAAERQKKETEEAGRKAAEAAAAAEKARQQVPQQVPQQAPQQAPAAPTQAAAPKPGQAPAANVDQIHAKYLQLHQRMKEFRKAFWEEHKKPTSPLKGPVGDARRALRTRLGQINVDRTDSTAAIKRLRTECFDVALNTPGPMIDIRQYIVSHQLPQLANQNQAAYPAFLLYVWICFEKFLIGQFEKEAANPDGRIIQEIGLIAASLFGDQKYMWNGVPLTDIVLAKLHKACPPLFGIRGTMDTQEGRLRLGWRVHSTTETYAQRMRGIGAGYASMSLRSFASKTPAIAISEYWRAIASIVNTPPDQLWPGHFAILSGLIRDYHKKFIQFYGVPARAVLRRAVIDLPMRAPDRCKDAASTIAVLSESWKRENFSLD
ncbi:rna export mediator gle1 [Pyrenophora tritici-repentis]|uniref:mRNA export factor GLE1 n=1 Tax=Pyrenophora tritici-repentis TaxID=45151 RepID=A0A2W1EZV5_9PLEO|nr:rna export mediator gle1 [Pyrenophora tritici-repentis]KAF7453887.1 rna export mediator gle1 [Pyrenophora tritici-repentis]KAF7576978.1 TolA, Membrane protein involved in colicin uptake [Pyrenophora tritici-repentis]KAG9387644.1 rna export mediator gle1 [Pyrenophora tritici-repentis]KAI0608722.1 rna export mediator gle1 [Pyrenophora tritici-repentis]